MNLRNIIGVCGVLMLLVACSGSDGPPGPQGPAGPAGPPANPGVDIAEAGSVNAAISGATFGASTSVDFTLTDDAGNPVFNLPADAVSFKLARLAPGTDGNPSAWQSYINRIEQPGVGPGTEPKAQATTENGATGTFTDNGDGSYSYTFAVDITNVTEPVPVEYVDTLTHRVSLEIRGFAPVRNPWFDARPSDGATDGIFTREIADLQSCNLCHENLSLHGGARFELQDCVTCHNPGSADANSGNTVDMTVMTHKIHMGENLPSVIGGMDYCIYGFRDSQHCYGDVAHPQDIRNCANCHDDSNEATDDASNWYTMPTVEACGACHDDVNFETGENHGRGIVADNSGCVTCHASDPDSRLEVRNAHRIVTKERTAEFDFSILGIDFAGPGTAPVAMFSVSDPTNDDSNYDLATHPELSLSPLRFYVAWSTTDYSNAGSGTSNAQPERTNVFENGVLQAADTGGFVYTLALSSVPASASGSGVVTFEGRVDTADGRVPVTTAHRYFSITDDPASPTARRSSVDIARCNDCHDLLSFHGGARNNSIEACQVCHIADAARGGTPSAGPMDMKHFLHRLHAVDDIRYPQRVSNCTACHTVDGFYPAASDSGVLATSFNRGVNEADPTDNNRMTANTAVCSVCHVSADALSHMRSNGGSQDACQEADGTVQERLDICGPGGDKSGAVLEESCTVCHGPGRISDVGAAHGTQ